MFLQRDTTDAAYQIQRYEPGCFWINDTPYHSSIIIRADTLLAPWGPSQINDILPSHFQTILDDPPEIVLLGTGSTFVIPPQHLLIPLWEKGIGVEYMDSKTACFTYMALICENRRVAACLMP